MKRNRKNSRKDADKQISKTAKEHRNNINIEFEKIELKFDELVFNFDLPKMNFDKRGSQS